MNINLLLNFQAYSFYNKRPRLKIELLLYINFKYFIIQKSELQATE